MANDLIPFSDKGDGDVYDGVTVLTDSGLRLIGKLLAQQGALKITRAVVGDGQLPAMGKRPLLSSLTVQMWKPAFLSVKLGFTLSILIWVKYFMLI